MLNTSIPDMPTTPATQLELRWIPVVDTGGRTRMEARWVDRSGALSAPRPTPVAAGHAA